MSRKGYFKKNQQLKKELEKKIPKIFKSGMYKEEPSETATVLIKIFSAISVVLSILFGGFVDYPPKELTLIFFSTSLLCMLLAFLSKGKVPLFYPIKISPVSFIFIMISTSLACGIKIIIINYINTGTLTFFIILFLIIFFILFLFIDKESRKIDHDDIKADRNILTFFGALAFSLSFVVVTNKVLDFKEPKIYSVNIAKKVKKFKKRFFYIQLSKDWPYHDDHNEIIIEENLYNSVSIGDKIDIVVWEGALGIKYCRASNKISNLTIEEIRKAEYYYK